MPDTPIPLATSSTYTLVTGDIPSNIFCRVTAHNSVGDASADSNTVGPVVAAGGDTTAPTITSSASVSNAENSVLAHSLTANETVTWSLVGGADIARFELSGSTLRWLSNGTKDFEAPNDADTNNAYIVQVRATDTSSNTTNQTITVTVTNIAEGAYTGPGDVVAGAAGWWGLRAYSAATIGTNCVRLVRASDSAEQDFVTLASGALDVASIATFLTATTGKVVTLYDQSGNTRHATQVADSARPVFTLGAKGALPAVQGGAGLLLQTASFTTIAQPFTFSAVVDRTGSFTAHTTYIGGVAGPTTGFSNNANELFCYASAFLLAAGVADSTWHAIQTIINGASSELYVGGATVATGDAGTGDFVTGAIVMSNQYGQFLVGYLGEVGIWPAPIFDATKKTNMNANQTAYWGL